MHEGQKCVFHADRITPLGKQPVIASLSLGAMRVFRMKRASVEFAEADAGLAPGILLLTERPDAPESIRKRYLAACTPYLSISMHSLRCEDYVIQYADSA